MEEHDDESEIGTGHDSVDGTWDKKKSCEEAEDKREPEDVDEVDFVAEFEENETAEHDAGVVHGVDHADLEFGEMEVVPEVEPVEVAEIRADSGEENGHEHFLDGSAVVSHIRLKTHFLCS